MAKRRIIYVSPQKKGWAIKMEGAKRATKVLPKKADAIKEAKKIAKNQLPAQLKIQKQDGTFQIEYTYGKDPYPPQG